MTLALLSAASGKPLRGDLAMTGEVTLRGNILPIGGLNEKLLAARRVGVRTVFVPKDNSKDVDELAPAVKQDLEIVFVDHVEQAVPIAFRNDAVTVSSTRTVAKPRAAAKRPERGASPPVAKPPSKNGQSKKQGNRLRK
jgi:ATP-dependent Lon protease